MRLPPRSGDAETHAVALHNGPAAVDTPLQERVIGEHQGLVWLPLKAGDNEVLLELTEIGSS